MKEKVQRHLEVHYSRTGEVFRDPLWVINRVTPLLSPQNMQAFPGGRVPLAEQSQVVKKQFPYGLKKEGRFRRRQKLEKKITHLGKF